MNNPTRSRKIALRIAVCALITLAAAGCGTVGPQPWEKDLMAQKKMQLDAYAQEFAAVDHIYFSKEASSGGRGFAGGGCGCN